MHWQADQGRQGRTPLKKCLPLGLQRILMRLNSEIRLRRSAEKSSRQKAKPDRLLEMLKPISNVLARAIPADMALICVDLRPVAHQCNIRIMSAVFLLAAPHVAMFT